MTVVEAMASYVGLVKAREDARAAMKRADEAQDAAATASKEATDRFWQMSKQADVAGLRLLSAIEQSAAVNQ